MIVILVVQLVKLQKSIDDKVMSLSDFMMAGANADKILSDVGVKLDSCNTTNASPAAQLLELEVTCPLILHSL